MEEKVIESYDGRKFRTKAEMCEFFGIERKTYDQRIKRGWSQKKALTEPVKTSPLKSVLSEKERQSISFKKYYAQNRVRENERTRAYKEANRDAVNAQAKIYREKNKDRIREYQEAYRNNPVNREKARAYQEAYREKKRKERTE